MILERWYSDMVRFMTDSSEYGDYYQQLAAKLQPWLSKDTHICDAGSGLGYLSLALAPYVRQVTAVERHPDAAAVLERNCVQKGIVNVRSRCGAVETTIPSEKYDAMAVFIYEDRTVRLTEGAEEYFRLADKNGDYKIVR